MEEIKPYRVEKPWGDYETFTQNRESTVKILTINPHEAFSLQTHSKREEYWRVIQGSGIATIGEDKKDIKLGDEIVIPIGTKHRLEAGEDTLKVLEISIGEFDEEDIIRLEDRYGRV